MIGVIFEVWPAEGKKQAYLDIAAKLKPLLEQVDGFVSVERFESLHHPGKILSLSFFRDQGAVEQWRKLEAAGRRPWDARACFMTTGCVLPVSFGITACLTGNRRLAMD